MQRLTQSVTSRPHALSMLWRLLETVSYIVTTNIRGFVLLAH